MKRNRPSSATAVADGATDESQKNKNNGNSALAAQPGSGDLSIILAALQTMRDGGFSVRLPGSWTGMAGKIADTSTPLLLPTSRWRRN
jgi:hypothetical protein